MQRTSFESVNCSVAQCMEVVGEWWSLLIIRDPFLGCDPTRRLPGPARHKSCGHVVEVVPVCSHCGEPLDARSVTAEPGPGHQRHDFERTALASK